MLFSPMLTSMITHLLPEKIGVTCPASWTVKLECLFVWLNIWKRSKIFKLMTSFKPASCSLMMLCEVNWGSWIEFIYFETEIHWKTVSAFPSSVNHIQLRKWVLQYYLDSLRKQEKFHSQEGKRYFSGIDRAARSS